jgi:hypothetical protein
MCACLYNSIVANMHTQASAQVIERKNCLNENHCAYHSIRLHSTHICDFAVGGFIPSTHTVTLIVVIFIVGVTWSPGQN